MRKVLLALCLIFTLSGAWQTSFAIDFSNIPKIGSILEESKKESFIRASETNSINKVLIKTDNNGIVKEIGLRYIGKFLPKKSQILGPNYSCKKIKDIPFRMAKYECTTQDGLKVLYETFGTVDLKSVYAKVLN